VRERIEVQALLYERREVMSGEQKFEAGKYYKVNHTRKGRFSIRVTLQDKEWLSGTIIEGVARALCDYNVRETGEAVTLRKSHITSSELLT